MVWTHLSPVFMVIAAVCALPAQAKQSGPLIGDLVEYGEVRGVIPATTAETFGRTVLASQEQTAAAELLVDGARTEVARVVNRHLRTVRDDPTLQQILESESKVVVNARAVEQKLLGDLMEILTPEQRPLFAKFERAHRRSLLRRSAPQPMPVDLWRFYAANKFDPSKDEVVGALLERFDRESDAALVRQRQALKAYFANVRLGVDGTDEAMARDRKAQNEFLAANANLDRVFASVVEPLIAAQPPELTDKLVLEIIELSTAEYDRNLSNPDRYPIVREVLTLDLTPAQRSTIRSIIDSAKADALAQARSTAIEQARHVLLDDKTRTDGRTSPLNLYLETASKMRVRVSNEVLALLTPAQRQAYDASEVIAPSSTSTVRDD